MARQKENPLTFQPKTTGWIYVRKDKKKASDTGTWPMKTKLKCVTTYLATGNMNIVSQLTGVPYETIRRWKLTDWWQEATDRYYDEENVNLDAKLTKILEKSIASINDRIDEGDFQYDPKTGKLKRVPVKLRDLHKVSTDLIDKQQVLRKKKTQVISDQQTTSDRLQKLAEAFAQFVVGKQEKVIEGEFHAVHDQREERLQERTQLGAHQETQPGEEPGSEEQS